MRLNYLIKEEFYSELNNSSISDEDYEHAQKVWNAFNIHNLGEYSDLYLKTDFLLLADVLLHHTWLCMGCYVEIYWYKIKTLN